MEQELTELKQGSMSVSEYTIRFNELVRYAADGDDAPTEAWKMKKFHFGLRADIAHGVSMQPVENFGDLVQKSYRVEAGLRDIRKERGESFRKQRDSGKFNSQLKARGSSNKGSPLSRPDHPETVRNVVFLTVGNQGDSSGTAKTKGRVYSLDGEEAKSNNALITDVCYLDCVMRLGLQSSPLIPPMTVAVGTTAEGRALTALLHNTHQIVQYLFAENKCNTLTHSTLKSR
ncbi:hypothetical protein A2U01_0022871 [Trifolium medium]|uniref:Retrotransposon gag domain-containing protein n=1 Tax=Trifolium medium TaxID=97028 RepID=A0A392NR10_9FABA|nr:hypothetical protein [Trifolium medium]